MRQQTLTLDHTKKAKRRIRTLYHGFFAIFGAAMLPQPLWQYGFARSSQIGNLGMIILLRRKNVNYLVSNRGLDGLFRKSTNVRLLFAAQNAIFFV